MLDMNLVNRTLSIIKMGFVPSDAAAGAPPGGGDPGAGGMPPGPPPGDPSAGAPLPPSGDPSMGSGVMPPVDPSASMPPMPSPDMAAQIASGVAQALQTSGLQGNKGPTAPKPDINTIATDLFQLKKMFLHYLRIQGIELPPDILDGPNRDPMTGAPAAGPAGGSDAQPGSSMQQAGGGINPIKPMSGQLPAMGKSSSYNAKIGSEMTSENIMSKAAAVAMLLRRRA